MKALRNFFRNLTRPAPLQEFGDYNQYWIDRLDNGEPPLLHRHRYIASLIPDGCSVLDIGCGDGVFLRHLRSEKPNCRIVGMDVSSKVIDQIKEQGFEGFLITDDELPTQVVDQKFDYVVMMDVIEHVHEAEHLVRQAAGLVIQRLFLTLPNVGFLTHRLRLAVFGRFPVTTILFHMKEHVRFWTTKDFTEWVEHLDLFLCHVSPQLKYTDSWLTRTLATKWPGLFAAQVIYEIAVTEIKNHT